MKIELFLADDLKSTLEKIAQENNLSIEKMSEEILSKYLTAHKDLAYDNIKDIAKVFEQYEVLLNGEIDTIT